MNTYRGKHVSSQPWPIASGASGRGRFQGVEGTILNGEDLDVPTYLRRRITLDR